MADHQMRAEINALVAAATGPRVCAVCTRAATCLGAYGDGPWAYACDTCCGHGCEDGRCYQIDDQREGLGNE